MIEEREKIIVTLNLVTLDDLLGILNVLNASPSLTELHEELIQLVLKKIKKELGVEKSGK